MKKFLLLLYLLFLFFSLKAQDRIININHDTIHCTIISINNARIIYQIKNQDGSVSGKFIPRTQVVEYSCTNQAINKPIYRNDASATHINIPGKPLCIGINAGISTLPWYFNNSQSSALMPDYYNKLKRGFHIQGSLHYMVKEYFGLGVDYSFFKSSTSGTIPIEYGSAFYLMESETYRQYINILGGSLLFQQHIGVQHKFILSESLSVGVSFLHLEYQNTYPNFSPTNYYNILNNLLITGNSISGKFGFSAEYRFYKDLSLGLGSDFIWSSLKKAIFESKGTGYYTPPTDKLELEHAMKLSRLDFFIALRYYFHFTN